MALNTFKCDSLIPLHFKGLMVSTCLMYATVLATVFIMYWYVLKTVARTVVYMRLVASNAPKLFSAMVAE